MNLRLLFNYAQFMIIKICTVPLLQLLNHTLFNKNAKIRKSSEEQSITISEMVFDHQSSIRNNNISGHYITETQKQRLLIWRGCLINLVCWRKSHTSFVGIFVWFILSISCYGIFVPGTLPVPDIRLVSCLFKEVSLILKYTTVFTWVGVSFSIPTGYRQKLITIVQI